MNRLLITLMMASFLFSSFAQSGRKDVVYLKSGGVIKGQLITRDAAIVKINSAGNDWVFNISDVDSVVRHERKIRAVNENQPYYFDTSLGVLVGNSSNSHNAPFSFMTSANYRLADKVYLGAGLGTEFLEETYLPAFGQVQYLFRNSRLTPFAGLQAGYMVALEDGNRYNSYYYPDYSSYYPGPQTNQKLNSEGGFFFNPSIGFRYVGSQNYGWFFSFGYRHHQLNFNGDNGYELERNYSRLSLKIGFIFN